MDTGAQMTSVTQRVVEKLDLLSDGWTSVLGIHGTMDVPTYTVDLGFGIVFPEKDLEGEVVPSSYSRILRGAPVSLMNIEPSNFDILLGMDLLHHFHLTIFGDKFILSN